MPERRRARRKSFRLEEATIDEMHAAIRAGEVTCVEIVHRYIDRARAFNGVASSPVILGPAAWPAARRARDRHDRPLRLT